MRLAWLLLVLATATASAAPPPASVDLDGDGRAETLVMGADGQLAVGAAPLGVKLETAVGRVTGLAATVATADGKRFLTVTAAIGRSGQAEAVLATVAPGGRSATTVWRGVLGPQDRDRERWVRLDPAALLLWNERPDLTTCDGTPARLLPRRFDPASNRFRAIAPAEPVPADARPLTARLGAPPAGLDVRTRPRIFRAAAATTTADDGGDPQEIGPPVELEDLDDKTAWSEAKGGWGRGEMLVFRAPSARFAVRALRIVPGDASAWAASNRLKRALLRVGDQRFVVDIPAEAKPLPRWIELPAPIAAACVSVTIDEVIFAGAQPGRTAISELVVLTDADAGTGQALDQLAAEVIRGGKGADDAEHYLAREGEAGARALVAAAGSADDEGRRRAAFALARLGSPLGARVVTEALARADGADAERLARALETMGPEAAAPLVELAGNDKAPVPARARALRLLGGLSTPGARAALERHLGDARRELRAAAIRALAARSTAELPAAMAATADPDPARAGDAWRVVGLLAKRSPSPADVAPALVTALGKLAEAPYPLKYRLAQTGGLLVSAPGVADALATALGAEPEPALRVAALEQMPPEGRRLALAWLADPDPGVRAAAVAVTAGDPPAEVPRLLVGDPWPLVRQAAVRALAPRCPEKSAADPLVTAAGADGDERVRREALSALVSCKEPRAGKLLLATLRDDRLAPSLRSFAANLAASTGDRTLVAALADELEKLRAEIPYSESEGSVRVAAAIAHALGRLRDPRAAQALFQAAADPAVPPIQAAAATALGEVCPAGAASLLDELARSPETLVARAARGARRKCAK